MMVISTMKIAMIVAAMMVAVLAEDCPRGCSCSDGMASIAHCTRLDTAMFFPERVTHLVVDSVPGLKINLTRGFFKTIGLHQVLSIKITNCTITSIDQYAFEDLPKLTDVNLSDNGLILIHPDTFESNNKLERLTLSGNPLQLTQLLKGEEDYFLKSTSLSELDLSRCQLSDVGKKLLSKVPNLEYISLRENGIKVIDDYIFEKVPFLDEIDLSDNMIMSLNDGILEDIEDLTALNLKNNLIENIEDLDLPGLKELDISHNNLKMLRKTTFEGIPDLATLNISHNGITWISEETFNDLTELRHLDLSNNALMGPLPKFIFEENEFLETLSLAGNKEMKIFEGFSTELPTLYKLDISECGLSNISNSSFSGMPYLAILNISMNSLTTLNHVIMSKLHRLNDLDASYNEITKVGTYTFASNSHLRKLNLSHNKIHHLSPNTFETTPYLSSLDISHNQLSHLWNSTESEYMKDNGFLNQLEYLNVEGNRIRELHKQNFGHLINLKEINILENPIECTSEFPAFIEWLYIHHVQPLNNFGRSPQQEAKLERSNLQWDELLMDICKHTEEMPGQGSKLPAEERIEIQKKPALDDDEEFEKEKQDLNFYQYTVIEDVKLEDSKHDKLAAIDETAEEKEKMAEEITTYVWPTFLFIFSIVFITLAVGNTVALLMYRSRSPYGVASLRTSLVSPFKRSVVKLDNTPRYHKLYEECSVPNPPIVKGNLIGNLVNSQIGSVLSKSKNDDVV